MCLSLKLKIIQLSGDANSFLAPEIRMSESVLYDAVFAMVGTLLPIVQKPRGIVFDIA